MLQYDLHIMNRDARFLPVIVEPQNRSRARLVGASAPRRCMEDAGRPLGAGLQEQASNHLKLHWKRARAVSVKEKVPQDGIR